MNPLPIASRKQSDNAFSLIEVVLALAVSAIGLVAILGLLPQGLQASRDAADNTISATIVHDIFSTLRASPFLNATNVYSLGFTNEVNGVLTGPTPPVPCNLQTYSLPSFGQGAVAYFDKAGFTPATRQDWYYKVTLNFQPETVPLATVSMVMATVVWPALSASPINTNIFVTKVAQYYQ